MGPEPEEAGEMVDKMVIDGYTLCVNKMKTLSITTSTTPEVANKNSSNLSQGFFYRPKFTEIFEISFLSTGSDKI